MLCSKPGCARAAAALLSYDYAARTAMLHDPHEGEPTPHAYTLCGNCAEKLRPPRGWILQDLRSGEPLWVDDSERFLAVTRIEPIAESPAPRSQVRRIFFGYDS